MMKCGILTINVNRMNYGNRLQNFAMQEILKRYGLLVETVNYKPSYDVHVCKSLNAQIVILKRRVLRIFYNKSNIFRILYFPRNYIMQRKKRREFNSFVQSNIKWSRNIYEISSDFTLLSKKYDFIVCGSDQVWNPYWEGTNSVYFMGFMPEEKRIAYAVSFGVSDIPDYMVDKYKDAIMQIPYISCREERGVEIVRELTGRNVQQVLDPVFLINKEEWIKLEKKPARLSEGKKYILVYFLGGYTDKFKEQIQDYSVKYRLPIIFLDRKDKWKSIFATPDEFLYLVGHAKLVCTDSFHGVAFSILFNVPFVCFSRTLENGDEQNMSSRFTSLFHMFQCDSRYAERVSKDVMQMDFTEINQIIAEKKLEADEYLRNALGLPFE